MTVKLKTHFAAQYVTIHVHIYFEDKDFIDGNYDLTFFRFDNTLVTSLLPSRSGEGGTG